MLEWLYANFSSAAAVLLLALIVLLIIIKTVRDRKNGRSGCGCGCDNCPMSGDCNKK